MAAKEQLAYAAIFLPVLCCKDSGAVLHASGFIRSIEDFRQSPNQRLYPAPSMMGVRADAGTMVGTGNDGCKAEQGAYS